VWIRAVLSSRRPSDAMLPTEHTQTHTDSSYRHASDNREGEVLQQPGERGREGGRAVMTKERRQEGVR